MALNPGLPLQGKQLPTIPPNSTNEEQLAALNSIVDKLNNNTQEIVATGTVHLPIDGSFTAQVFTIAHNLGFKPRAFAYMNGINITIGGIVYSAVDFPLPTYLSATGVGVGGAGGSPSVAFGSWLDIFVDTQNLYIHIINATSTTLANPLAVTYYLTREATT